MMHDAALSLACPAGARSDGCTCEFLVAALCRSAVCRATASRSVIVREAQAVV